MSSFSQIQQLMTEIGPLLELSEVTEFTEDQSWVLVIDDETVVAADLVEEIGKLVLSAEVATPPAEKRNRTYQLLLEFNHQWPETDGLRMGLDGPGGMVVMMIELPVAGLDIQRLQTVVGNFVEQIAEWRELILEEVQVDDEGTDEEEPPQFPMTGGMIRA